MDIIDTRDLIKERDDCKQTVVDAYNKMYEDEQISDYENIIFNSDLQDKLHCSYEIDKINEIDGIENEIGEDFHYGVALINTNDFEDYIPDYLEDIGYIPTNFPSWIVINWTETASNILNDYSEIEYDGNTYYYLNT